MIAYKTVNLISTKPVGNIHGYAKGGVTVCGIKFTNRWVLDYQVKKITCKKCLEILGDKMKLKQGMIVWYNNNIIRGKAVVKGVSSAEMPVIGSMVILEDLSNNIPTSTYKFDHFVLPQNMLSLVEIL